MVSIGDLQALLDAIDAVDSHAELGQQALAAIAPMRLTAAASGIITGSTAATDARFHFVCWPEALLARYLEEEFQADDPGPRWARASGSPTTWSRIVHRLAANDPGRRVIQAAADFGMIEGVVVPMRAADGAIGLVSMGGNRPPVEGREFRAVVAIATAVFRRAERIDRSDERGRPAPILTLREIELLPYLIHGHPDREIARLMNIAEATVRFHLRNARIKVGAVSRTHLAAKVVGLGLVAL